MQEFFEKLYNSKLERKENQFYTLGDEVLDKGVGLDQLIPSFSTSKEQIENFAALCYLYGSLGYKVANFTAIPAGYIAGYERKHEGDFSTESATLLISDGTIDEYREKLVSLLDEKIKVYKTFGKPESEFFELAKELISNKKEIISGQKNKLTHICVVLSDTLKKDEPLWKDIDANAIEPFYYSNTKITLNKKNCDDNQLLIERICREILGYPVDEKEATKEQIEESKVMGYKLLQNILVGYKKFMGDKMGNKPESQILSDKEFENELLNLFKTPRNVALILNICATDFSADVIYELICKMLYGGKSALGGPLYIGNRPITLEERLKGVDEIVAETPDNAKKKSEANRHLHKMGYIYEGELDK